jgi:antitoxin (DNA-binding transcriptional repressor) of toxin-antitoxin stability system
MPVSAEEPGTMAIVTIGFAKAHLLQLINPLRGDEIVIARGSKPVVRLVAIAQALPSEGTQ